MTDLDAAAWGLPAHLAARLATAADADPSALSDAEAARLTTFAHDERRRQFVLGRVAARTLAAQPGEPARAVALAVGADGAPEIPGRRVSIAHTGQGDGVAAALAAVAAGPVGVDLERVAPRRPNLWTRILAPQERPLLDALGGPSDDAQTLLWTLKEAVLKGQRTGFRAGARSIRLTVDADGAPPDRGVATATAGSGDWRLAFGRHDDLWLAVAWQ